MGASIPFQANHTVWSTQRQQAMAPLGRGQSLAAGHAAPGINLVANKAREMFGGMADPCFKPSLFARFAQDSDGYISATLFAAHLIMRAHMQALRIQLSSFDEGDTGCLKEQQLGEFLRTQAMELELLEDMQER
ncbi:uncharacterized protein HaLaN_19533 [Haematococcus lacustris]|uniref:EF-hand domain-containing protein n=1 Tax=Haematococcus lacustris TaxID=44745 RepID=A0A699ZR20_HAELA|nr:uncharacterized protein HaLaN_19533 [Haematococcus lacustris]